MATKELSRDEVKALRSEALQYQLLIDTGVLLGKELCQVWEWLWVHADVVDLAGFYRKVLVPLVPRSLLEKYVDNDNIPEMLRLDMIETIEPEWAEDTDDNLQ